MISHFLGKTVATTTNRAGANVKITDKGQWHCEGCDDGTIGGSSDVSAVSSEAQQHADTCNFKRA